MELRIFSLFDIKSGAYGTPFFMHHVGEAIRACIDLGGDQNTTVGRHPADFALHELGTFDTDTGFIKAHKPAHHGVVVSLLPRPTLFDPAPGGERLSRNGVSGNGMEPHASAVEA